MPSENLHHVPSSPPRSRRRTDDLGARPSGRYFEGGAALSYVLYFRDGGRSHIVYNYDEMAQDVLAEFMEMFKEEFWDTLKWEGTKSGTKSGT